MVGRAAWLLLSGRAEPPATAGCLRLPGSHTRARQMAPMDCTTPPMNEVATLCKACNAVIEGIQTWQMLSYAAIAVSWV